MMSLDINTFAIHRYELIWSIVFLSNLADHMIGQSVQNGFHDAEVEASGVIFIKIA